MPRAKLRNKPATKSRTRAAIQQRAANRTTHIRELRRRIDEYCEGKFGSRCQLCGLKQLDSTRAAFHYHHLDPSTKLYNIGEIWAKFKDSQPEAVWKSVQRELAKTVFLCAVCHAKVHYHLRRKTDIVSTTPAFDAPHLLNDQYINQSKKEN